MTSSRSIGSSSIWRSASCRSCVAPQMVSKKRNSAARVPRRRGRGSRPPRAAALPRSRRASSSSGWPRRRGADAGRDRIPRECAPAKFLEKRRLVAAVADVIADVIGIREREHHEVMAFAVARSRGDAVALVSSCAALPWMMEVTSSLAFCRTRFQTLITSPQVVSTIWQPILLDAARASSLGAEGGHDDHVLRRQVADLRLLVLAESS